MRRTILRIDDSNIAGFVWCFTFVLGHARDRTLTLTPRQSARGSARADLSPARGLVDGVDLYRALSAMLNVAGYSIEDFDLDEIAADISQVEKSVAQQFLEAPSQVQAAQDAQRQAVAIGHEALVAPFSVRIEAFVKRFSDEKLYLPGAGYVYPSQRHWMRKFIKSYLIANGTLPMGRHQVRVDGYSGGEHDFSDLAA